MPADDDGARPRKWGWRGPAFAVAAVLALAAGWGVGRHFDETASAPAGEQAQSAQSATADGASTVTAATDMLRRPRPEFDLPDLNGNHRRPGEWSGRVLVLNFWATWCAPCREEIPMLMELDRREPEVQVVGIALDSVEAVREFARELDITYPIVFDDASFGTMHAYGNRAGALPFTAIVDRGGTIAYVRLGALHKEELEQVVGALLP